jgi:outer membrane porin, OprD family
MAKRAVLSAPGPINRVRDGKRPVRWSARALGAGLLITCGTWAGPVSAEDAPPPPPLPTPLEALFLPVKEQMKSLPPFLRDTDLRVNFRSYYFNRTKPDDTVNEAEAFGGSIGYRSGWLFDTFSMGATLYGSAPLYAPDDRDGTLLLKPDQKGYYVPGEAWGALRYGDYALLKGYRQLVNQSYINPQDNRMTPNTFEALTLGGKIGWVEYLAGFLWNIKTRNSDEFVAMSSAAGIKGEHDGVGLSGVRLTPIKNLRIDVSNQYGVNMFNTVYVEGDYLQPLNEDWSLRFGAQITDQRAVGDALLPPANGKYWVTHTGGARIQVIFKELTVTGAFSITGSGNTIQSPWGSFPGYLSVIDQDFDRAREKAILLGAAYDFSKLLTPGLSANFNLVWGRDAINPSTRRHAPDQSEYDFTTDYRPDFRLTGILRGLVQGMWFRARAAILDQEDAKKLGYQFRIIINWDRDLI